MPPTHFSNIHAKPLRTDIKNTFKCLHEFNWPWAWPYLAPTRIIGEKTQLVYSPGNISMWFSNSGNFTECRTVTASCRVLVICKAMPIKNRTQMQQVSANMQATNCYRISASQLPTYVRHFYLHSHFDQEKTHPFSSPYCILLFSVSTLIFLGQFLLETR